MKKKLVIVGAGGHGKVVKEAALLQMEFDVIGFTDDRESGNEILGTLSDFLSGKINADYFVVAIGNNEARKNIFEKLSVNHEAAVILHPSAVISASAKIGRGTVVLANAVINAEAIIGENCIINSLSLIDHQSFIGNHSHIAQGAIVGSNVKVKDNCTTELGERIKSFSA